MNNKLIKNKIEEIEIIEKEINGKRESVISSIKIAEGTKHTHKTVVNLIRKNISELEEFGKVHFEKSPSKNSRTGQYLTITFLNERQCTLLLTFMRNNEIVKSFKINLVKTFWKLKQAINHNQTLIPMLENKEYLRNLALNLTNNNIALLEKVETLQPKADALELITSSNGRNVTPTVAAKELNHPPRKMSHLMQINTCWTYWSISSKCQVPYERIKTQGLLDLKKSKPFWNPKKKKWQIREQIMITPKGVAKLAEILAKLNKKNKGNK